MAKKKKDEEAAPEPEVEVTEEAADAQPDSHIGIDHGASGDYTYYEYDNTQRDRTVHLAGKTFEHVAEDAAGCWLYRHLG